MFLNKKEIISTYKSHGETSKTKPIVNGADDSGRNVLKVVHGRFEKITIKEITDRAGVIRPTFYNHFQDKYELLEWIINQDLIEPMKPFIRSGLTTQAMTFLFVNIEKEKEFYMKVCRLEGQNSFISISQHCLLNLLEEVCEEHRERRQTKYEWLTPERLAQYYGQSMVFVMIEWIQSGMTISAEDLAELYQYMISHSLEDALKDL